VGKVNQIKIMRPKLKTKIPKVATSKPTSKSLTKTIPTPYPAIETYFKDKNTTTNSLMSLSDLRGHTGWRILQAYLTETKAHLMRELLNLRSSDVAELSLNLARIQEQLKYIDYLLSLPQLIIDSYTENLNGLNLDPF